MAWPTSDRWDDALKGPHQYVTTATVTLPGGSPEALNFSGGSLSVDAGQRIRRRINSFAITGDTAAYEALSTPGAVVSVQHGISFGGSTELVPVIYGEVINPRQTFGDGSIDMTIVDLGHWLSECPFATPYVAAAGATRVSVIAAVIAAARPGTVVSNLSSDTGTLIAQQVWTSGPGDVISDLTRDGNTEGFFLPDGSFLIRDLPTIYTPPVWYANSGEGGVLISAARTRATDRLINKVIVRPSSSAQTWIEQYVEVTDTTDPRYKTKIGERTYTFNSPSANSSGEALVIAQNMLSGFLGGNESVAFGAIANPALEANDVLRIGTPRINTDPALTFQHFLPSFSLDLESGDMTGTSRQQVVTDG